MNFKLKDNPTCANWSCSVWVNLDPLEGAEEPKALSVRYEKNASLKQKFCQ